MQWINMKKIKKHLKTFENFEHGDVHLIKLIDNNGVVVNRAGKAIEGIGIFDEDGSEDYMAGVADDNTLYVNISTEYGALNNDGEEYAILVDSEYDGRDKYELVDYSDEYEGYPGRGVKEQLNNKNMKSMKFKNFIVEAKKDKDAAQIETEAKKVATMMFDGTGTPKFTYDENGLPNSIEFSVTEADYKLDYSGEEMKTDYTEGVMKKRKYKVILVYLDKYVKGSGYKIRFGIKLIPTSDIKYEDKTEYWVVWEFDGTPTAVLEFLEGDEDEGFTNYLEGDDVEFSGNILKIKSFLYKKIKDDIDDLIADEGGIKMRTRRSFE